MQIPSNWTPAEVFHVTGTLPAHMIETLLEGNLGSDTRDEISERLDAVESLFHTEYFLDNVVRLVENMDVEGVCQNFKDTALKELNDIRAATWERYKKVKAEIKQLKEELE